MTWAVRARPTPLPRTLSSVAAKREVDVLLRDAQVARRPVVDEDVTDDAAVALGHEMQRILAFAPQAGRLRLEVLGIRVPVREARGARLVVVEHEVEFGDCLQVVRSAGRIGRRSRPARPASPRGRPTPPGSRTRAGTTRRSAPGRSPGRDLDAATPTPRQVGEQVAERLGLGRGAAREPGLGARVADHRDHVGDDVVAAGRDGTAPPAAAPRSPRSRAAAARRRAGGGSAPRAALRLVANSSESG